MIRQDIVGGQKCRDLMEMGEECKCSSYEKE
jgi:hypothetical protein